MKRLSKTIFEGSPDLNILHIDDSSTIAVPTRDIQFIRPKLLVKKDDTVKIGTPLFCDKRNPDIQYVSPGAGQVKDIIFGPRRKLLEVVIALNKKQDGDEDAVQYDPIPADTINLTPKEDIINQLKQGGLWQCFKEFPARNTADETNPPPMIIVSLNGNDPFSPEPELVLKNEIESFKLGLALLKRFSARVIVAARQTSKEWLEEISRDINHVVPDSYPCWDPGVILYKIKTHANENHSWTISLEHLILVAKFLLTGIYPIKRVLTVSHTADKKPHIVTRQGIRIRKLIQDIDQQAMITTGHFNGNIIGPDDHLGFFETTLNIIKSSENEEFFGFMKPGFRKHSVSKTFISSLRSEQAEHDCNLHGEERACINCGYCTKICPVDLMPSFIMKALHADDIEEALELGILDCCRCGLCSYTCPSKIELARVLSQGIDAHFMDKE